VAWYSHLFFWWHIHDISIVDFAFMFPNNVDEQKTLQDVIGTYMLWNHKFLKPFWVKVWKKEWVMSKDCIFHIVVLYWFILHFSRNFFNWISNLKPDMTYKMIKTLMFLHQTLHYNQIYNFTLNHDYKFKL